MTKRFPGVTANNHVDLSVARGEIRAIMGRKRSGEKHAVQYAETGILSPTEGEIYFCGTPVSFLASAGCAEDRHFIWCTRSAT